MTTGIFIKPARVTVPGLTATTGTIDLICEAVSLGMQYEDAAVLSHLSPWQAKKLRKDALDYLSDAPATAQFDESYKALLRYFLEKIARAQAEGEKELLKIIWDAAPSDWKAADRLLQIMKPEKYSTRKYIHRSSDFTAAPEKTVDFKELSDEQLRGYIDGEVIADETPLLSDGVNEKAINDDELSNSDD